MNFKKIYLLIGIIAIIFTIIMPCFTTFGAEQKFGPGEYVVGADMPPGYYNSTCYNSTGPLSGNHITEIIHHEVDNLSHNKENEYISIDSRTGEYQFELSRGQTIRIDDNQCLVLLDNPDFKVQIILQVVLIGLFLIIGRFIEKRENSDDWTIRLGIIELGVLYFIIITHFDLLFDPRLSILPFILIPILVYEASKLGNLLLKW